VAKIEFEEAELSVKAEARSSSIWSHHTQVKRSHPPLEVASPSRRSRSQGSGQLSPSRSTTYRETTQTRSTWTVFMEGSGSSRDGAKAEVRCENFFQAYQEVFFRWMRGGQYSNNRIQISHKRSSGRWAFWRAARSEGNPVFPIPSR